MLSLFRQTVAGPWRERRGEPRWQQGRRLADAGVTMPGSLDGLGVQIVSLERVGDGADTFAALDLAVQRGPGCYVVRLTGGAAALALVTVWADRAVPSWEWRINRIRFGQDESQEREAWLVREWLRTQTAPCPVCGVKRLTVCCPLCRQSRCAHCLARHDCRQGREADEACRGA